MGAFSFQAVLCWEILGSVLEGTSGDWWSCAGRYWDLCKGTRRVWDPGGDIRGCAGGCERGLCGAVLGLCWGWGRVGTPARRGQRGRLGTGLLWHGTAVRSLQRGLRPCTDPAQAWVPLPAAPPAVFPPLPSPGVGLWRGAGLRPAVRGPVGQTLPSGPRGASAPAAHHGAASPSPCPQLCRHDPAGGGSEKTRGKKRLLEGLELWWWAGGGRFAPSLKPTPLLTALSVPAPTCSVPGPPTAPAGPDPARGCSLGHGAVFPTQPLLNPTTPRHRGARPR